MSELAFSIATHDPENSEKGVIAGREFYARKFTLAEVQGIAEGIKSELEAAVKAGRAFTVKDEMKPIVKALNARRADGKKPLTVNELADALSEDDYRAVLTHYAPSLLPANPVGGSGNA